MRIIAGKYKGRDLLPPPGGKTITRPMTGLVKKSLFGMLGEDLTGQTVVDLFCGTGTLGIEALSRRARHCFFAERDPSVLERLQRNIKEIGAQAHATIWRGEVEKGLITWLQQVHAPIDVAFVDPPYPLARDWDLAKAAEQIFAPLAGQLAEDGVVVLRTDDLALEIPQPMGGLMIGRVRQYGNMVLTMLVKPDEPQEPQEPA